MIGTVLGGRYAARSELGRGGNAKVLLAEDLKLGRAVAVKVLVPSTHTPKSEAVARLEREARVAASIAHPNVCTVTDVGELADGSPFLVMELLSG
jgi:eukaryotic-like serine/threonine-protein kinase